MNGEDHKEYCKEGECPRVEGLDAKIDGESRVNCIFRRIVYAGVGFLLLIAGFNTWYQRDVPTKLALIEQWQIQHQESHTPQAQMTWLEKEYDGY